MAKNIHIWLWSYIKGALGRKMPAPGTRHVIFSIADHFEPGWGGASLETGRSRIDAWIGKFRSVASSHRDADGCPPKYTIFYPEEEYVREHVDKLSALTREGFAEVEAHIHHDNDTPEGFRKKMAGYIDKMAGHGLLSRDRQGRTRYAFIHGNWSLDNSRPDGRWCGVNNELEILRDTGCYADFTMPSAPSDTQTRKINSIYYAKDTPGPKSHDTGVDVEVGRKSSGDLMLVQGPLGLNWKRRKFGIFPRIENGELTLINPPTPDRIDIWVDRSIGVKGRPEWIFVKVYTHGLQESCLTDEYFRNLDAMFDYLEKAYNDGSRYRLHYATTREMYNMIKAAEAGECGELSEYREYELIRQ